MGRLLDIARKAAQNSTVQTCAISAVSPTAHKSGLSLDGLLIALRAARVRLDVEDGTLRVSAPAGALMPEIAEALRRHETALLTLPRPYITEPGELVMPCLAAPQYHWQPMTATLTELDASRAVWERHTSAPYPA